MIEKKVHGMESAMPAGISEGFFQRKSTSAAMETGELGNQEVIERLVSTTMAISAGSGRVGIAWYDPERIEVRQSPLNTLQQTD